MLPLSWLTASEEKAYFEALADGRRQERYTARALDHRGRPLSKELEVTDGWIEAEADDVKEEVTHTAHVTVADPDRLLKVSTATAPGGTAWIADQLQVEWGLWVRSLDKWIDVPVFTGPVFDVARRDDVQIDFDCQGKEANHLPPATFPHAFSIRRNTRISSAIKEIARKRGENRYSIDDTHKRLRKDKTWALGQNPWKGMQNLADVVDQQLFYRGEGTLRLRPWPNQPVIMLKRSIASILTAHPEERVSRARVINEVVVVGESKPFKVDVRKHTELTQKASASDSNVHVTQDLADATTAAELQGKRIAIGHDPEIRTITNAYAGGTEIPLSSALSRGHPKGAPVKINYRKEKTKRIFGRAKLKNHPLSADNLSDGKRPLLHIEHRPRLSKKAEVDKAAAAILERKKRGLDDELTIACLPFPVEIGDRVGVEVEEEVWRQTRVERYRLPLRLDEQMTLNWLGRVSPKRGRRGGFLDLDRTLETPGRDGGGRAPDHSPGIPGGTDEPGAPGGGGGGGRRPSPSLPEVPPPTHDVGRPGLDTDSLSPETTKDPQLVDLGRDEESSRRGTGQRQERIDKLSKDVERIRDRPGPVTKKEHNRIQNLIDRKQTIKKARRKDRRRRGRD